MNNLDRLSKELIELTGGEEVHLEKEIQPLYKFNYNDSSLFKEINIRFKTNGNDPNNIYLKILILYENTTLTYFDTKIITLNFYLSYRWNQKLILKREYYGECTSNIILKYLEEDLLSLGLDFVSKWEHDRLITLFFRYHYMTSNNYNNLALKYDLYQEILASKVFSYPGNSKIIYSFNNNI